MPPDMARGGPAKDRLHDISPAATLPDQADIAALLALSGERDQWLARVLDAWRDGYMHGAQDQWSAGYAAAIADVKRAQHKAVKLLTPGGEAWLDDVRRHGGTEYGGAGKPRIPVDPRAIELARLMGKGRAA